MIRKYKASATPPTCPDSIEKLKQQLLSMDVNQITAYAMEHDIDIGGATTQQGIYKKIIHYLEKVLLP